MSQNLNNKVIWLTGISGAGKTTIGSALNQKILEAGKSSLFLDGDVVRDFFEGDLGFSRADRIANVRRVGFAAKVAAELNANVVVANIAPYFEVRDFLRKKLASKYVQIYLKTSVEKVMERDVKGLYEKYKNGETKNLVGVDDPYEEPRNPDLILETDKEPLDVSIKRILDFLKENHGVELE
ncbi:MAG: adenylyl-sulfate kinase [Bacteriovoracaceae bacterium]|nr:adenylyl-sulfate kinase [Bacteriovoracaceae bacterium]